METLLQEFQTYLEAKGYRENTVEGKIVCVRGYLAFLAAQGHDVYQITVHEACRYKEYLVLEAQNGQGNTYSVSTVNNYLKSLRTFYRYLFQLGRVYANPFSDMSNVKAVQQIGRTILTVDQMRTLLSGLDAVPADIRCIIHLLYGCGCRIDELRTLKSDDLHCDAGYLVLRDDKSRKDRICVLPEITVRILRSFPVQHPYVFGGKSRSAFVHYANNHLARVCQRLSLPRISCHGIRHSLATHLVDSRADIRIVQEILGHKHIKSSEVYTHMSMTTLQQEIHRCHPREVS